MYRTSAPFYDLQYRFLDHAGMADRVLEDIERLQPDAQTLLDVGCGTGLHLERFQRRFDVEGQDLSVEMLAVARQRCPGVPLHEGDMVHLDVGRRFDVIVSLFAAVAYVQTFERLSATFGRLAAHLAPGGLMLIEPFFTPSSYWVGHVKANFIEDADVRMAWMYRQDRQGDTAVLDIHHLVATQSEVVSFTDRHQIGLFREDQFEAAFAANGLEGSFEAPGRFHYGMWQVRRAAA